MEKGVKTANPAGLVIVDIWGGPLSQKLMARYVLPIRAALTIADEELKMGYLVNLRSEKDLEGFESFDIRTEQGLN